MAVFSLGHLPPSNQRQSFVIIRLDDMMFKKSKDSKKRESHLEKTENLLKGLTPEQWHEIALEMNWGCMLPGGLPDSIWYFY